MASRRAQLIKDRCQKFRVLIVGRANAGKTTILQRVCDTTEDPEIYNKKGEKLDRSVVAASAERGEHDIDNEMVFKSNPGFCFHDSRGFESGGVQELDKVNAFIKRRSVQKKLENRLHAIWYCIPVDDSRPFTAAENQFFSVCGTGSVPMIALFTKFDALDNKAFAALRRENLSRADAKREAPGRATAEFEQMHLDSLYAQPYPPKGHVCLRDMNKPGADCSELIKQTTVALDGGILEQLLVSTQRNSLELCLEYAIKRVIIPEVMKKIERKAIFSLFADNVTEEEANDTVYQILLWFPHFVSLSGSLW